MNMVSAIPGHEARDQAPAAAATDGGNQQEARVVANLNLNLDQASDISGALRSVMDLFSQHAPQERDSRGPFLFSSSSAGFRSTSLGFSRRLGFLIVLSMVAE